MAITTEPTITRDLPVAGVTFTDPLYLQAIAIRTAGGVPTHLAVGPEPTNPADPDAIAVYAYLGTKWRRIGYVPAAADTVRAQCQEARRGWVEGVTVHPTTGAPVGYRIAISADPAKPMRSA